MGDRDALKRRRVDGIQEQNLFASSDLNRLSGKHSKLPSNLFFFTPLLYLTK